MSNDPFSRLAALDQQLFTSKPVNQQTSKEESQIAVLPTSPQTIKPVNQIPSKPVRQVASKPVIQQRGKPVSRQPIKQGSPQVSSPGKKFTSYLSSESIKAIKRLALETDRNDYEVLQEAVDEYLGRRV